MPLVVIASLVSMGVGYYGMLPDDYENLAESVVATNMFSNNILQDITTKNYWDVVNDYKPLMHTWYLGILVEFYVVFPLIVQLCKCISDKSHAEYKNIAKCTVFGLTMMSLVLYLMPQIAEHDKFYMLPCRFFEIAGGGLVGVLLPKLESLKAGKKAYVLLAFVLTILICWDWTRITLPKELLLLGTIIFTCLLIVSDKDFECFYGVSLIDRNVAVVGKMSFSIYVWHQIVLAFTRYYFDDEFTWQMIVAMVVLVAVLSILSYLYIEKRLKQSKWNVVIVALLLLIGTGYALYVFRNSGVVRDVLELDITKGKVFSQTDYIDRVYKLDCAFDDSGKAKVLVVGNSFGRDWSNVLLESTISDKMCLRYIFPDDTLFNERHKALMKDAEVVFIASDYENYEMLKASVKADAQLYVVGTKNFGKSNGKIYKNRMRDDYFQQTVRIQRDIVEKNEALKAQYGEQYIDLIERVSTPYGEVRVFTSDHRFISQDCRHLTKAGCQYFATLFDFGEIIGTK